MEGKVGWSRRHEYRGKAEKETVRVKVAFGDYLNIISFEWYVQTGEPK